MSNSAGCGGAGESQRVSPPTAAKPVCPGGLGGDTCGILAIPRLLPGVGSHRRPARLLDLLSPGVGKPGRFPPLPRRRGWEKASLGGGGGESLVEQGDPPLLPSAGVTVSCPEGEVTEFRGSPSEFKA